MRVLIVVSQWGNAVVGQGIGRPARQLANELCDSGYVVHVLLVEPRTNIGKSNFSNRVNLSFSVIPGRPWGFSHRARLRTQELVAEAVMHWYPDVVVSQDWRGLTAAYSKIVDRPPLITWIHGGTMYDLQGKGRVPTFCSEHKLATLEKTQIEHSQLVVSPSELLSKIYREQYGLRIYCDEIIPYHFPKPSEQSGAATPGSLNLVFVGRLSRRKGVELFVEAAVAAKKQLSNVRVQMFGKSVDYDGQSISKMLAKSGIEAEYFGELAPEAVWSMVRARKSVLVVTSVVDNSPNTVYEAIANQVPVAIIGAQNGASELRRYSDLVVTEAQPKNIDWHAFSTQANFSALRSESFAELNRRITTSWLSALKLALSGEIKSSPPNPNNEQVKTRQWSLSEISAVKFDIRRIYILVTHRLRKLLNFSGL